MPDHSLTDSLTDVLSALADPTRRTIVERLAEGEAPVGRAAAGLELSPAAISKHVKVLERSGLIRRRVVGREHRLSLAPDGFATATAWFAHYQQFWTTSLDRLAALVAELEQEDER